MLGDQSSTSELNPTATALLQSAMRMRTGAAVCQTDKQGIPTGSDEAGERTLARAALLCGIPSSTQLLACAG